MASPIDVNTAKRRALSTAVELAGTYPKRVFSVGNKNADFGINKSPTSMGARLKIGNYGIGGSLNLAKKKLSLGIADYRKQ